MTRPLYGLLVALTALPLVGCGGGNEPAGNQTPLAAKPAAEPKADPIAEAAEQFLDAVVKGDTPRATAMLTPVAQQQFAAAEQSFASPESGAPDYEVGEVRRVTETEAAVQCLATDETGVQEMCCLLKSIDGQWRVSGMVFDAGPEQEPVIFNFEHLTAPTPTQPNQTEPSQQPSNWVDQPGPGAPAARTATRPKAATR